MAGTDYAAVTNDATRAVPVVPSRINRALIAVVRIGVGLLWLDGEAAAAVVHHCIHQVDRSAHDRGPVAAGEGGATGEDLGQLLGAFGQAAGCVASGKFISMSAATSSKNFAALPLLTTIEKCASLRFR